MRGTPCIEKFMERFWARVIKTDGCWEWTGKRDACGYGKVSINGKNKLAHRVSIEMVKGPIPAGLLCLHHCDNPRCVRPDHLYMGTQAHNAKDRTERKRYAPMAGGINPNAKLTWAMVEKIRSDPRPGKYIIADYGISRAQTSAIRTYRSWRYRDGIDCKPTNMELSELR